MANKGEDGLDGFGDDDDTEVDKRLAMEALQATRGNRTQEEFAKADPLLGGSLERLERLFGLRD